MLRSGMTERDTRSSSSLSSTSASLVVSRSLLSLLDTSLVFDLASLVFDLASASLAWLSNLVDLAGLVLESESDSESVKRWLYRVRFVGSLDCLVFALVDGGVKAAASARVAFLLD